MSSDPGGEFDCHRCDERQRHNRNCRNRTKVKHTLLQGADEWRMVSSRLRHVLKIGDLKYFECPRSAVTGKTWQILSLVNETTDAEGNILHLPFEGPLLDQPIWYREAVKIVKQERARHQREQWERTRGKN